MKLKSKIAYNISFIFGIFATLSVAAISIFHATSNVLILINISAFVIVVGGVFSSAVIMQPFSELKDLFLKLLKYIRYEPDPNWKVAADLVNAATIYSQFKSLDRVGQIQARRLVEALELVQSGMKKSDVLGILATKRECSFSQSSAEAGLLLTLAKLAPGYGLVGTIVGLVVLLYDLGTGGFDKVGPAMAIALLATLYGVLTANMVFMPIAEFILHRSASVARIDEMLEKGVESILDAKHHIHTREVVRAFLSSNEQKLYDVELKNLRKNEIKSEPQKPLNTQVRSA